MVDDPDLRLPEHSLRTFISVLVQPIHQELRESRAAIQELAAGIISQERIETLKYQVASQNEEQIEMRSRLNRIERLLTIQLVASWTILIIITTIFFVRWLV